MAISTHRKWVLTSLGPMPGWGYRNGWAIADSKRQCAVMSAQHRSRILELWVIGIVLTLTLSGLMLSTVFMPLRGGALVGLALGCLVGLAPWAAGWLTRKVAERVLLRRVPPLRAFFERELLRLHLERGEDFERWYQVDALRPVEDSQASDLYPLDPPV